MASVVQRYSVSDVTSEVFTAKFSPDGILLATGSNDGKVRVYDASLGTQRACLDGLLADRIATGQGAPAPSALGSEGLPVTSVRWRPLTVTGGSRHVVMSVSADGTIRHWNAVSGHWLGTILELPLEEGPGGVPSHLPKGGKAGLSVALGTNSAGTGAGSAAALRNALAGRLPHQIFAADYCPDGSVFATAGKDKSVRVYDEETRTLVQVLSGGGSDGATPGHSNRVFALAWHPVEPSLLLSAGWDGTVQVQDTRVGHAVRGVYGSHVCGDALAWLPEGVQLAGGATSGGQVFLTGSWRSSDAVQAWDYGSGRCMGCLHWWGSNEEARAWAEGDRDAAGGGKEGPHPPRDGGFVYALSVSRPVGFNGCVAPAGAYLAAGGSGGNEVKVWRTADVLNLVPSAHAQPVSLPLRPVVGTVSGLSHAVYGLDWSDMTPAVLGGDGGEGEGEKGLPKGPVPTLLVVGGEAPLRLFHVLDKSSAEVEAEEARGVPWTGHVGVSHHALSGGEGGWAWHAGDIVHKHAAGHRVSGGAGAAAEQQQHPAPTSAQPSLPPSLRRGSAALRAVMDARLGSALGQLADSAAEDKVGEGGGSRPVRARLGSVTSHTPSIASLAEEGAEGVDSEEALLAQYGGEEEEEEEGGAGEWDEDAQGEAAT